MSSERVNAGTPVRACDDDDGARRVFDIGHGLRTQPLGRNESENVRECVYVRV